MSNASVLKGLVLAGGQSRRMGRDKALLARGERTQLAHAVELLSSFTAETYVSARRDQRDETERARFAQIVDRYDDLGPAAGILSAMDADPEAAWLVLAVDLPNVDETTLQHLVDERDPARPFTAYRSSYDELPEPLCAIYEPSARTILDEFIAQGSACPRKVLIQSDTKLLTQPHATALDNINTPQDLALSGLRVAS